MWPGSSGRRHSSADGRDDGRDERSPLIPASRLVVPVLAPAVITGPPTPSNDVQRPPIHPLLVPARALGNHRVRVGVPKPGHLDRRVWGDAVEHVARPYRAIPPAAATGG